MLLAVGIGGDRLALWSHPAEVVVDVWPSTFAAPAQQTVGQQLPEPPR